MKQIPTKEVSVKTQTGPAPANRATVLLVSQRNVFGGGLFPKAGVLALLLGAGLLTAMGRPKQPQYGFSEITLPGPGFAVGINDSGLVTGYYTDPVTGDWYSFLMQRGVLTTGISAPGASVTALGPANNLGVEGGNYGDETHQRPVFYDIRRGTFAPLPEIPGMPLNFGDGINDFGHASGVAYSGGTFDTGGSGLGMNWTWDGHNYSFFTVPGAVNGAFAGGINNQDQVAGYYVDSSGTPHGFVRDGSKYTTLDVPGALLTLAYGINNRTVVTGLYFDASDNPHGFFWSQGQFVTVDAPIPGAVGSLWYGSNERGDLAGYFEDANQVSHAVIAIRVSPGDNLQDAYLAGLDLSGDDLSGANLHGADLSGADLSGADLAGANLQGANLAKANFTGANLSGANLQGAVTAGANFTGANIKGCNDCP